MSTAYQIIPWLQNLRQEKSPTVRTLSLNPKFHPLEHFPSENEMNENEERSYLGSVHPRERRSEKKRKTRKNS